MSAPQLKAWGSGVHVCVMDQLGSDAVRVSTHCSAQLGHNATTPNHIAELTQAEFPRCCCTLTTSSQLHRHKGDLNQHGWQCRRCLATTEQCIHLLVAYASVIVSGGSLGLMNVFSRYLGGAASDRAAEARGMRGRMWVLLLLLLLEGVLCLLVGITHDSLAGTVSHLAYNLAR